MIVDRLKKRLKKADKSQSTLDTMILSDNTHVQVIRTARKTLSMQVREEGLLVRAPFSTGRETIVRFVSEHSEWIRKQKERIAEQERRNASVVKLTQEELGALKRKASEIFPERAEHYARMAGVTYGRITIRAQRTRWGSCNAKGDLSFNCLLLLAPPEVLDSVVVHELCHRKVMNHTARFYEEVNRLFPGYSACDRWLKENGALLLARL